jgi:hypothetical protein
MDDTTTEAVVDSGATAQPESGNWKPEAVLRPTEEEQPQQEAYEPAQAEVAEEPEQETAVETEAPSEDDTSKWLKAKGIDPSDPEAINKLAKSAREAERAMHQKAQRAKELERSMTELSDESAEQVAISTGQDPELLKRVQRFEVKSTIRDFFESNPEAKAYEQDMIQEMNNSGLYGSPEAMLRAAYAMAVSKNPDKVRSQARKETLENLAQKQQASVPTGNATNAGVQSIKITPQNVDQLVAKNDLAWFQKHYDEINRAMAG